MAKPPPPPPPRSDQGENRFAKPDPRWSRLLLWLAMAAILAVFFLPAFTTSDDGDEMPFDEFLQERLFDPLGMVDTGFHAPSEKADRVAVIYAYAEDRSLVPHTGLGANDPLEESPFLSGGGGLVSTPVDYMRFAQMVRNGGELDGVRILSPLTIDLMSRNQLPKAVGEMRPGNGTGFGLDFAVVTDPVEADGISKGEFYWSGLAGCWFWIDPVEDLVFVGMIQQMGQGRPDIRSLSHRLIYQAILEPAAG